MKKIKTLKFFLDIYFQRVSDIEIIVNNKKSLSLLTGFFLCNNDVRCHNFKSTIWRLNCYGEFV